MRHTENDYSQIGEVSRDVQLARAAAPNYPVKTSTFTRVDKFDHMSRKRINSGDLVARQQSRKYWMQKFDEDMSASEVEVQDYLRERLIHVDPEALLELDLPHEQHEISAISEWTEEPSLMANYEYHTYYSNKQPRKFAVPRLRKSLPAPETDPSSLLGFSSSPLRGEMQGYSTPKPFSLGNIPHIPPPNIDKQAESPGTYSLDMSWSDTSSPMMFRSSTNESPTLSRKKRSSPGLRHSHIFCNVESSSKKSRRHSMQEHKPSGQVSDEENRRHSAGPLLSSLPTAQQAETAVDEVPADDSHSSAPTRTVCRGDDAKDGNTRRRTPKRKNGRHTVGLVSSLPKVAEEDSPSEDGKVEVSKTVPDSANSRRHSLDTAKTQADGPRGFTPINKTSKKQSQTDEVPETKSTEPNSPEANLSEADLAQADSRGADSPEAKSPEAKSPEAESLEAESLEVNSPEAKSPDSKSPRTEWPAAKSPDMSKPDATCIQSPGVKPSRMTTKSPIPVTTVESKQPGASSANFASPSPGRNSAGVKSPITKVGAASGKSPSPRQPLGALSPNSPAPVSPAQAFQSPSKKRKAGKDDAKNISAVDFSSSQFGKLLEPASKRRRVLRSSSSRADGAERQEPPPVSAPVPSEERIKSLRKRKAQITPESEPIPPPRRSSRLPTLAAASAATPSTLNDAPKSRRPAVKRRKVADKAAEALDAETKANTVLNKQGSVPAGETIKRLVRRAEVGDMSPLQACSSASVEGKGKGVTWPEEGHLAQVQEFSSDEEPSAAVTTCTKTKGAGRAAAAPRPAAAKKRGTRRAAAAGPAATYGEGGEPNESDDELSLPEPEEEEGIRQQSKPKRAAADAKITRKSGLPKATVRKATGAAAGSPLKRAGGKKVPKKAAAPASLAAAPRRRGRSAAN